MDKITVVSCEKVRSVYKVIIEDSPLYPDGKGGQLGDRGKISDNNIISVEKDYVMMDGEVPIGENNLSIDHNRRKDIAVQHTAQHLFSAVAYNNYSLNTVGFRMSEEYSTVDLDSKEITEETVKKLEKAVNDAIRNSLPVEISTFTKEEVSSMERMRKAVSEKVEGDVRIVKIGDLDINACGGFHVENTGEMQLFKILSREKVKGNYTRFFYISGDRALEDYYKKNNLINKLCQNLSCKNDEILFMLEKISSDKKDTESELRSMSQKYAELLSKELMNSAEVLRGKKIIFYSENNPIANFLPRFTDLTQHILIYGDSGQFAVTSETINCQDFLNFFRTKVDVKGGGNEARVNLKGDVSKEVIFQYLEEYLSKL